MNNNTPADAITHEQYESAVKGRQDFRNAYRNLLPVLRAAEELSRLWRTKGQRVDDEVFFNAINAVDVAVTGGGAKPDPEHLTRTTSLAAQDGLVDKAELREAIETAIFSRAVDIIGRLPSEAAKFPSVLEQYAEVATAAALASIEVKSEPVTQEISTYGAIDMGYEPVA